MIALEMRPRLWNQCEGDEHANADDERGENGVVAAGQRLPPKGEAKGYPTPGGRTVREPMKRQKDQRDSERHRQLDVSEMSERVRAEREADPGDRRGSAVPRQVANQVVRPDATQNEREQKDRVVCRECVPGQPVSWYPQQTRTEIRLRVGERAAGGKEDVCVEHVHRVCDQGSSDPGDVPDGELAVSRDAELVAQRLEVEEKRVGEGRR